MKILFAPMVPLIDTDKIKYDFKKDVITVTMPNGESDTFDFTGLPDGVLDTENIDTTLDPIPLLAAHKHEGVLYVKLLNFISYNATEEEKFPSLIDYRDYVQEEVNGEN